MDRATMIHRVTFDDRLPWLAGLHSAEEDQIFFRERVFPPNTVLGAFEENDLVGFIAFREGWIEQLYILPDRQRRGVGRSLLVAAKSASSSLSLWTFQRNEPARRFYETQGFVAVEETDGSGNEEHEPDVLYRWTPGS